MNGTLHILPMLMAPLVPAEETPPRLSVTTTRQSALLAPDRLMLRWSSGARRLAIGGTALRTCGWLAPVRNVFALQDAGVVFRWIWRDRYAEHRIKFDLRGRNEVERPFWSMAPCVWPLAATGDLRRLGAEERGRRAVLSAVRATELGDLSERRVQLRENGASIIIEEILRLDAIELDAAAPFIGDLTGEVAPTGTGLAA